MSPTHAPSPCLESGCFELATHKGRCERCQLAKFSIAKRPGAHVPARVSARERGYDQKWEKRRRRHLEAEPFCRARGCGKPGNQVDHVIPHRGVNWLFVLEGNLQTLCRRHHAQKSNRERTIPIGMMYPLDLPDPPHGRPIRVLCGPFIDHPGGGTDLVVDGPPHLLEQRNEFLRDELLLVTERPLTFIISAPRTAERAFWSHVMGCEAELVEPPKGHATEWWADFMMDSRAEEAMARRRG